MMTDDELEARVRRTLRAVADATPVDDGAAAPGYATAPARPARPRWLTPLAAAAAVVVLVGGAAIVLRAVDDGEVTVSSPPLTLAPPQPDPTDPTDPTDPPRPPQLSDRPGLSDGPVFIAEGDPGIVLGEYLNSRMPDVSTNLSIGEGIATATWSLDDDSGRVASGTVHLAYLAEEWGVVEAETDDVAVDDLRVEDGTLRATISTTNVNSFVVEVLDLDGGRLRGSERIGPTRDPVDLDVTIGDQPVIVRVQLIGGAMLSITELLVDPLAPEGGQEVAGGGWNGGTYRVLAAGDCAWIQLNGLTGTSLCGIDPTPQSFAQFGPVSRAGGDTLYYGVVGDSIERVEVRKPDGNIAVAQPAGSVPGRPFRVITIVVPAGGGSLVAEFVAGDGTLAGTLELDPAGPLGG